jgi:peptide/nickel transport system ATP-binding protein
MTILLNASHDDAAAAEPSAAAQSGAQNATLLSIDDLTVSYDGDHGPVTVLSGADLTLRHGEVVALVGSSGSGKTTLTRTVLGLLPEGAQTSGRIVFRGEELTGTTRAARRRHRRLRGPHLALVPQDPGGSLDPVNTIGAQFTEIWRIHPRQARRAGLTDAASRRAEAVRLLEEVGVDRPEHRLGQYPHELSGGLKQRVLIAMAFALGPELLIADEPTSALDPTVQRRVLGVFDRLARSTGTAVLFVTHDIALAADHADRIVVLDGGQIVEEGPARRIVQSPEHPRTRALVGAARADAGPREPAADAVEVSGPAVEVVGLRKVYGRHGTAGAHVAVDGVSLSIEPGTTYALVGESGSGKSTTAKAIMGLIDPTDGEIRVLGHDVGSAGDAGRRQLWKDVQLVYQNPDSALDPRWSVERIIAEPLVSHGVGDRDSRRHRVAELLEQVGLPAEVAPQRPGRLSGGQRQRVAIARALALGAKVLVLDEALSALDVVTREQIITLLRGLQAELGVSCLFISHDLHVVRRLAHRVGVMQAGRLVEEGTVEQVFTAPQHPCTQALLEAVPGRSLEQEAA